MSRGASLGAAPLAVGDQVLEHQHRCKARSQIWIPKLDKLDPKTVRCHLTDIATSGDALLQAEVLHAGSMARTAGDLVLLDSIIRNSAANTTGKGAVATPLSCAVNVSSNMSLQGVRLGLPSTEGWVPSGSYDGISGEVMPPHQPPPRPPPPPPLPNHPLPTLLLLSFWKEKNALRNILWCRCHSKSCCTQDQSPSPFVIGSLGVDISSCSITLVESLLYLRVSSET